MRLPRMTTRRWMIAVAVVATGSGMRVLGARSHSYAIQAGYHGQQEAQNRRIIEWYQVGRLFFCGPEEPLTVRLDRTCRLIEYHADMRRKYERASHRPWCLVQPDPPQPQ